MANNYLEPVSNHFPHIDDDSFLKNTQKAKAKKLNTNPFEEKYDDDDDMSTQSRQAYIEKRRQIEERTLDSSKISLGLLYETEEVGNATAVELTKQREQLEKTSLQLDEINVTLRTSQRHLTGLKSLFGGLKNYLSGNRVQPTRSPNTPANSSAIEEEVQTSSAELYDNQPVSRIRNVGSTSHHQQTQQQHNFESCLESNLKEMCDNLSRLKCLANNLGTEIESQNDLLDNMNYKVEDVDLKISKQSKQMNLLLKK
ncbi:synaptosomal-associated protein 29 [Scaptodrosophila lebanonensis]|uniref:Synaptosomal-associated protein 29 n=1 Tax=Drosophila lebanonensis TaxID=7225 RepID=A0A6J2TZ06_DROLE|nr:synaptosomal-associated protein 29 [Scaptodrosophila lebanonensis]